MAISTTAALVASLVAAAASAANQARVAKKQDQTAAAGIRAQSAHQREANQRINRTIDGTSKSTSQPEKTRDAAQYIAAVAKQMGQAKSALATRGLSAEYDKQAEGATTDVGDYGVNLADLFARMDAPLQQRQREASQFGDLGMDLDLVRGKVGSDSFLTQLKQQNIRPSAGLDFLAGALSGVGSYGGTSTSGQWKAK